MEVQKFKEEHTPKLSQKGRCRIFVNQELIYKIMRDRIDLIKSGEIPIPEGPAQISFCRLIKNAKWTRRSWPLYIKKNGQEGPLITSFEGQKIREESKEFDAYAQIRIPIKAIVGINYS